ncbi:zinc metallopeptidase [Staphylococcus saccharolyticus]|uniref:Neutral zinc metallopeptidase family n=1 Tax=Staphylococcus saccharolyticus TaxID=33028 RepID=A0A380H623_9STAP|nr:zinc metallopeptidase [Staphylococcus saccharolyticus]MBL7565249.1 zinc metallopeptidase [Staphylococcus saccharolyticus]MBL7571714.1 zinc metallopeptidase [Staphylococcus saccharolyticus]QQB98204.1 zinc metallopeptidase [Staphylococcus saccharolyticus]QRJ65943.1 zinc metallopeptidase [Staphylococcus saccharolyticus]SUM71783.1 Neutral zinc metallopeptidase family [Staphylococcus saccharolyticus]
MSLISMIIYFVILMVIPMWAQHKVKSNYEKYAQVRSTSGKTGREVAEEILHANGIYDVDVVKGDGFLTDHYDPNKKVVCLSPANYDRPSVAGTTIAAHEVGHAIQHQQGYAPLRFRTALVPLANIGSSLSYIVIMIGIILTAVGSVFGSTVLWVGAGLMSLAVLFSIVTLPVEFNASSRAMKQITALNIVNEKEYKHAKKVLSAAAMTYVASTAVALAELTRIILIARSSD